MTDKKKGRPAGQPAPMSESKTALTAWIQALGNPPDKQSDPEGKVEKVEVRVLAPIDGEATVEVLVAASKEKPLVYAGTKPVSSKSLGGEFTYEDGRERYMVEVTPGCLLAEYPGWARKQPRRIWVCLPVFPEGDELATGSWIGRLGDL
jgi:hypothetical protein